MRRCKRSETWAEDGDEIIDGSDALASASVYLWDELSQLIIAGRQEPAGNAICQCSWSGVVKRDCGWQLHAEMLTHSAPQLNCAQRVKPSLLGGRAISAETAPLCVPEA